MRKAIHPCPLPPQSLFSASARWACRWQPASPRISSSTATTSTPSRLELATADGITVHDSAAAAVAGADVVLLAVRDGAQLNEVLFGETGIATSLASGSVVILTSTVGTEGIAELASRLTSFDAALIDAPLSGGPVRARDGDLLIVVGAEPTRARQGRAGAVQAELDAHRRR